MRMLSPTITCFRSPSELRSQYKLFLFVLTTFRMRSSLHEAPVFFGPDKSCLNLNPSHFTLANDKHTQRTALAVFPPHDQLSVFRTAIMRCARQTSRYLPEAEDIPLFFTLFPGPFSSVAELSLATYIAASVRSKSRRFVVIIYPEYSLPR